ncbi:hypothetical protein HZA26_01790 [Candidatus Nomurabacteria bacterium]|nr:hypothetical protein [Candidatus Nomurabacteria bacterium]
MKNNIKETVVTVSLILVAILLLNPLNFWMPNILIICILAFALVLFGIFATFILREKNFDERDNIHRALAGRNAFLAGGATLMLAIVVQEYSGVLDPWLVIVLIIMILTKMGTRIWSDKNL